MGEVMDNKTLKLLERMRDQNLLEVEDHDEQELFPAQLFRNEISTMELGALRPLSPMLKARFSFCGSWINARLSQNWLSLTEIQEIDQNPVASEWMQLRRENWDHVPPQSVAPENCAIFAYNPFEPDETYLVWTSEEVEPEVWEYYGADYSVFKNLNRYLEYIVGDHKLDDSGRDSVGS